MSVFNQNFFLYPDGVEDRKDSLQKPQLSRGAQIRQLEKIQNGPKYRYSYSNIWYGSNCDANTREASKES